MKLRLVVIKGKLRLRLRGRSLIVLLKTVESRVEVTVIVIEVHQDKIQ